MTTRADLIATQKITTDAEAAAQATALSNLAILEYLKGNAVGSLSDLEEAISGVVGAHLPTWLQAQRAAGAVILATQTSGPGPISYTDAEIFLTKDSAMTPLEPTLGGDAGTWSIFPEAPAGLTLAEATGILDGTPTEAQGATNYVITCTNDGGSATVALAITVNAA